MSTTMQPTGTLRPVTETSTGGWSKGRWIERWEPDGGTQSLIDPRRTAVLAAALVRTWNAFIPAERPPKEEAREWYTAESP